MRKNMHKFFILSVILAIQLVLVVPNVSASSLSVQDKGASAISNAFGVDLSKVQVTSNTYAPQTSITGVGTQQSIEYRLTGQGNQSTIFCTFTDGNLSLLQVLKNDEKAPPMTAFNYANVVTGAQNFLKNCSQNTTRSVYEQFVSTLNNVDASKNVSQTLGNAKLDFSFYGDGYTSLKWTYSENGILAPGKFVAMGFNNNSLSYFVDNWQFYTIAKTTVDFSQKDAEVIALNSAHAHAWSVPLDTADRNFNQSNIAFASLILVNSSYADSTHNGDPLTLYPVWRVGVQLNRWYGDLYGLEVDVFADNGQVISTQEAMSTFHPQDWKDPAMNITTAKSFNANLNVVQMPVAFVSVWIMLLVSTATGFTILVISKRPEVFNGIGTSMVGIEKIFRHHRGLTVGILSCIIFLPVLLSASSIPPVKATLPPTAIVWGSESSGQLAGQSPPNDYWRKTYPEVVAQQNVAGTVSGYFDTAGYTGINGNPNTINQQGNIGSNHGNIMDDLNYLQAYGATDVAIVDFDHGVGTMECPSNPGVFHYQMEDQLGNYMGPHYPGYSTKYNGVYDTQIYWTTYTANEIKFAFISTCASADYTDIMDSLEYNNDPYLDAHQGILPNGFARGMPFAFTHRLVGSQMSGDAWIYSDAGAQVYIGYPKGSPSLSQILSGTVTYQTWVSTFFQYLLVDHMTVYNALATTSSYLFGLSFPASPLGNPSYGYNGGFEPYWPLDGENGDWPTCWMAIYGNANIYVGTPQYDLDIWCGIGGTTNPSAGSHYYTPQDVWVTANPSSGYAFDHWVLDNQVHYENPIRVTMDSTHYLEAYFHALVPRWVTVYAYNQYSCSGTGIRVYIDNQFAGWIGYDGYFSTQVPEGSHTFAVSEYLNDYWDNWCHFGYPEWTDHYVQSLYSNGNYYSNGDYIPITADTDVVAYYWSNG